MVASVVLVIIINYEERASENYESKLFIWSDKNLVSCPEYTLNTDMFSSAQKNY